MEAIKGWDDIQATGNEEYKRLVPGGYVCKITKVENNKERSFLYIEFDIADGEYAGYGASCLERNGFTPLRVYRSYTEKALGMFKGFIQNVEQSNPNYKWDWKEQGLVGKTVGFVLGEEEYQKQDGSVGTRFNARDKTVDAIKKGFFKVPEKKLLVVDTTPKFSSIDDDGELPF